MNGKIAVAADVHANLPAFEAVLDRARSLGCEEVYHLGDLIAIGPYPSECVDLAREQGVRCVAGNHEACLTSGLPTDPTPVMDDDELMHQHWTHSRLDKPRRDWLRALPYRIDRVYGSTRVTFVHFALTAWGDEFSRIDPGAPVAELLDEFSEIDADLVCFGHLHERAMDRVHRGRRFLNPGAAGCGERPFAKFSVVELSDDTIGITPVEAGYDRAEMFRRLRDLEVPARDFIRRYFFRVSGAGNPTAGPAPDVHRPTS
jgi:predicted phosphodiesterase